MEMKRKTTWLKDGEDGIMSEGLNYMSDHFAIALAQVAFFPSANEFS